MRTAREWEEAYAMATVMQKDAFEALIADLASLEARIAEVEGELKQSEQSLHDQIIEDENKVKIARERAKAAEKRLAEVAEALELAEWGDNEGEWNYCPVCGGRQDIGHAESCEIRSALTHAHEEEKK